jgi:hypothetical protein
MTSSQSVLLTLAVAVLLLFGGAWVVTRYRGQCQLVLLGCFVLFVLADDLGEWALFTGVFVGVPLFWLLAITGLVGFFDELPEKLQPPSPPSRLHSHGEFWHEHDDGGMVHVHPARDLSVIIPVDRPIDFRDRSV